MIASAVYLATQLRPGDAVETEHEGYAGVGFSTDRSESSRRMLSDSDSAEVLAMLIRETVGAYARTRALHGMLALTIAALLSCGCVLIDVPIYPDEWTRVHREGEVSCPDLTGTYAASGREPGLIKLFWFLPFWWSSNADSYPSRWVLSSVDKSTRDASERARTSDTESRTDATRSAPKGRRGRSPPSREDQPALNDGSAASPRFAISCARRWRPKQRAIT